MANIAPLILDSFIGTRAISEDTVLNITGIIISDPDGSDTQTVTLSVGNGILNFGITTNLTVTDDGTGTVILVGLVADINTALGTLSYTPALNYNGDDTLAVSVSDGINNTDTNDPPALDPSVDATINNIALSITAVNDAPVLTTNPTALNLTVDEDTIPVGAVGSLVSAFVGNITDVDAGVIKGIAITNISNQGTLYYSFNNGTNWTIANSLSDSSALLLADDGLTRLYFVSNTANFNGSITSAITFKAWDLTIGTNGSTADTTINVNKTAFSNTTGTIDITVNPVNDAPTRVGLIGVPNLSSIAEDQDPNTILGRTINDLFASKFTDIDNNNFAGIAIVANDASFFEGQWQWSNNNGFAWYTIESTIGLSNALLLEKDTKIRFLPYIDFNGTPSPLTVRLIDDSSAPSVNWGDRLDLSDPSTTGGITPYSDADNEVTLTTTVTGVNDAPVRLDDQPTTLTAVDEDDTNSIGETVSSLFGGKFSDYNDSYTSYGGSDVNSLAGVAIVKNTSVVSQGKWQYFIDGTGWIDIANDLSNSNALVLPENTKIRFLPAADFNGTPGTLTARLIDDSQGALTVTTLNFDTLNGGIASGSTTQYSDADNTVVLNTSINAVNDAPTRDTTKPNLQLLAVEDSANSGALNVNALFGNGFLDTADAQTQNGGVSIANQFAGVAIVANEATSGNGTWQYSINGTVWIDISTSLTTTNALVLDKNTLVRFKINTPNFNGEIGKLTARLLDNSSGEVASGNTLDVSVSNGTEIYSNNSNQVLLFGGVTPINDAPTINPVAIEIYEGGSGSFVNLGNFNLTDIDNLQEQLIIKIKSLPTKGTLTFKGSQLVVDSTLSADEIQFLRYTHNGNQVLLNTSDSFNITVEDGAGGSISDTAIPITIKPVNQLPSASGSQTLYEGQTGVVIPIAISDPDQSNGTPHTIKILTLPLRGVLKVNGSEISSILDGGLTVSSTDIISYDHDGNDLNNGNPPNESFNIEVIDDGGGTSTPGTTVSTITLNIIPNNDDPTLVKNTGTTLDAVTGREVTVTNTMLQVTDPDSSDTQLTYTLTDLPDRGYLLYNDGGTLKRMSVGASFTQADINNSIIRYRFFESGTGSFNDSFSFQVRDSEITAYPTLREGGIWKTDGTALEIITFPLTINATVPLGGTGSGEGDTIPVRGPSQPPIVDINTGVGVVINTATLLEAGTVVINNSLLKVTDPDSSPASQLVFRVAELPTSGTLKLNGAALRVYDSFTQEDINNGSLTFDHAGNEKFTDNFKFTISDGSNVVTNSGNPFVFNIDVTPQNDRPAIAVSGKPFLREGGTTGISPDPNLRTYITLSDVDGTGEKSGIGYATPNSLTFQVIDLPTHGYLQVEQNGVYVTIIESNKDSIVITKVELDANKIRYVHNGSENFIDSFKIQANDNTGTTNKLSNVTTVDIDIAPINDPPELQEQKNLGVFEGATATIKGSNGIAGDESRLIYKDPDNTAIQRQYFITNNVDYGSLFLNGAALGVGSVFSQDDLDNNRVTYKQDGSENHHDSFNFEVRDGGGGNVPGSYDIDVTPRNDAPTLSIPGVQNYFSNNPISITGIIPADLDLLSLNTPVETDRLRITLNPQLVAGSTYANGKLNLVTTTGITFINPATGLAYSDQVNGTNNDSYRNKVIIEGTLSDIQNALNSLQYQVNTDVNGTISLSVTIDDRLYDSTTGAVIGANGGETNQNGTPFSDANNTVTRNLLINTSSNNDAPQVVISTKSAYAFLTEDKTSPFDGKGSNPGKISITDADAFDSLNNTVTLAVTTGTISLTSASLITGGANGTDTITLTGSLTEINKVLEGLSYTPVANYNNFTNTLPTPDTLTITANDGGNSGVGGPQQTIQRITLVIRPVNDAPTRLDANPAVAIVAEDTATGNAVFDLFNPKFTDVTDDQLANKGSAPNILAGVAIVGNTNDANQGKWQWSSNGTIWNDINTSVSLNSSLILSSNALIRFLLVADFHGTPTGQLTTRLIDSSGSVVNSGAVLNLSAAATGGTTRYSDAANAVTLQASVTPVNDAPTATTGTVSISTIAEDTTEPSGTQLLGLLNSKYSDLTDDQTTKSGGNTATALSYVAIVGSTNYVAEQGTWQYSDGGTGWINIPVGSLSNSNALIIPSDRQIRFLPAGDFFGNPGTLTVKLADNSSVLIASSSGSDLQNLTTNGGIGTTGSWSVDNVVIATNPITNVNDAPTVNNPTTPVNLTTVDEDTTDSTGATVTTLFGSKYNDSIDNQQSINGGGKVDTSFAGIAIVGNASTLAQGKWEYNTGGGWLALPSGLSDNNALVLATTNQLRFVPAPNYYGDPGQLTVRVSDGTGFVAGDSKDIRNLIGTKTDGSGGWSTDTTTLATTINSVNDAPVLDGTTGTTQIDTQEDAIPVNVGSNLSGISDIEIGLNQLSDLVTATVTIDNFLAGDQLAFTLPSGVTATANGTGNVYTLSGSSATLANILLALQSATYVSTSNNPTNIVGGTTQNPTRTIQYQINDIQGINNLSNVITTTVQFTGVFNDAPSLTNASFTIDEDPTTNNGQTINTLFTGKFSDPDGPDAFLSGLAIIGNTANATTEGTWEYSTNGTNWFAVGTVDDAGTALALSKDTLIRFVPVPDYNGTPPALQVRALDNTYGGTFTDGNARQTVNTISNGGTTAIAATPTNLGVIVNPINDKPEISGTTGTRTYTENTPAIILVTDSGAIVDVDANNFPNGNVTLALGSYQTGDVLSVNNQGSSASQIGLSGSSVTYGGVTIGTINSSNNGVGKKLVINLNSQATKIAVQALLDNLTYVSTSDDPTVAGTQNQRTVNVILNDGNNGGPGGGAKDSNILTGSIDITTINDAPINAVPAIQTTLEDTTRIFNTANGNLISISDIDAGNQPVTVTLTSTNGIVKLSGNAGLIFESGTVNGSNNIKVTGTIAAINTALNGLFFVPTADYNNNFNTGSITIVTDDLGNTDALANQNKTDSDTIVINITPVNDAPVISLIGSPVTGTYTEGSTAFNVGQNIGAIADIEIDQSEPNVANNFTATATITDFFAGDVLGFTVGSTGVTVSDSGNGVYTLTGAKANVLQVLQSTTYSSTSPNPSNYNTNSDRVITYQIDDKQVANNLSNIVSTTVNITPVNDPPTVTATGGFTTFTEGNNVTSTPVVIDSGLTLNDVDNEKLLSATVSITGNFQNGEDILTFTDNVYGNITATYLNGVLSLNSVGQTATLAQWKNALRAVTYTNSSQIPNNNDRTISIQINDSAANSNITTQTVKVVPVNDTPILGAGSTVNYLENATATAIAPTMTLTNADTDLLEYKDGSSLTIAYTSGATTADQLSIANANGITVSGDVVSYDDGTGSKVIGTFSGGANGTGLTITFNGLDSTSTAVKRLLNNISFSNTSEDPVSGNRVFNITINDNEGGLQTATSSTTVNVIPVNDEPTLTSTPLNPNYVEQIAFKNLFSGSTARAIEDGQLINQLVFTVSNVTNGTPERIRLNGIERQLVTNGTNININNGFTANVSYNSTNKLSTITINSSTGATAAQIDALVNGFAYRNTSDDPTEGNRVVTIFSITDNGGTTNGGDNNNNPNLVSTVNVIPVNDQPTLNATGASATYNENASAVDLFSGVSSNTIESGQTLTQLQLTVSNLSDGANEVLTIDGRAVALTNGNSVNTTNGYSIGVSLESGTATLTITKSGNATSTQISTLVDVISYRNNSEAPTAGTRTIKITTLTDSGANGFFVVDGVTYNNDNFNENVNRTATVVVNPVNDAPVLDTSPDLSISTIEDGVPSGSVGSLISSLVGGISDVDGVSVQNGIALTNASNLGKIWYSTNGGTSWTEFTGTLSDSTALLLFNDLSTRIFFRPNTDINGTVASGITFRAWDRTNGTGNGSTANTSTNGGTTAFSSATDTISITITPANDAPTRTSPTTTLPSILEDDTNSPNTNPPGKTVFNLFNPAFNDSKDAPTGTGLTGATTANSLAGVAITANNANALTQGVWQYSTNNGSSWTNLPVVSSSAAFVLASTDLLRFVPVADYNGTPGSLVTRLIDNSLGAVTSGTTVDVNNDTTLSGGTTPYSNSSNAVTLTTSVTSVNDAPSGTNNTVTTNEDAAYIFTTANFGFTDPNDAIVLNILNQVKITTLPASGNLTNNGVTVTAGSFISVADINAGYLKFTSVTNQNGNGYSTFTFQVEDNGGTTNGGINLDPTPNTITVNVNPINDAPTATGTISINNTEDTTTTTTGTLISGLITGANYSDVTDDVSTAIGTDNDTDLNAIAVIGSSNYVAAQGTWQYGNGSGVWIDIPVSGLSDTAALIIPAGREIRFVPASNFFGIPGSLTVRLADSSSSPSASTASGDTKNLNSNGGIDVTGTWSSGTVVIATTVNNVNDRPTASISTTITGTTEDNPSTAFTITGTNFGYSDITDNQGVGGSNISGGGNADTAFGGIAIVGNTATAAQGTWQYNTGSGWVAISTPSDIAALILPVDAQLQFVPVQDFNGTPGSLTIRVADTSQSFSSSTDITGNLTQTSTWSDTVTLNSPITKLNDAPVITATINNPTGQENSTTGTGNSVDSVNLLSGSSVSDIDLTTTSGLSSSIFGAGSITVALTDGIAGDILQVSGSLPTGVTATGGNGDTPLVIILDNDTTLTEVQTILNALQYRSSSDNPTLNGTDTSRSYTVVVNDGNNAQAGVNNNSGDPTALESNTLSGTITINVVNDPPTAVGNSYTAIEDTLLTGKNIITDDDNGVTAGGVDNDPDNAIVSLTIAEVEGVAWTSLMEGTDGNHPAADGWKQVSLTNGTLFIKQDGTIEYQGASNSILGDSFTYKISDGTAISNAATVSIGVNSVNDAPSGANNTKTILEDNPYVFLSNDFGFTDIIDKNNLNSVKITTLPTLGSLTLNGTVITVGALISKVDIDSGKLKFVPIAHDNRLSTSTPYTGFTFQVQDDGGTTDGGINLDPTPKTFNIFVTPVNDAPIGTSSNLSAIMVNTTNPIGATISSLFTNILSFPNTYQFTDLIDKVTDGSSANILTGIAIVGNTDESANKGKWQYYSSGPQWVDISPLVSDSSALTLLAATKVRFLPFKDYSGTPTPLSVRLIDSSGASGAIANGGTKDVSNSEKTTAISNLVTLNTKVNPVSAINIAPVINELDGDFLNYSGSAAMVMDQRTTGASFATFTDTQGLQNGGVLSISFDSVMGLIQSNNSLGFNTGVSVDSSNNLSVNGTIIGTVDPVNNGEDGNSLSITFNGNVNNTLATTLLQNLTYQYTGTESGLVSLVFTVTDGGDGTGNPSLTSNQAVVDIYSSPTSRTYSSIYPGGTDLANILKGSQTSNINEVIHGKGSNDIVYGYGGDDILHGDDGADQLWGGSGDDILLGGTGNDILYGDTAAETLFGNDTLLGGVGNDTLSGLNGDDVLVGGSGVDVLTGGLGSDRFDYRTLTDGIAIFGSGLSAFKTDAIKDFNVAENDKILVSHVPKAGEFYTAPNITALTSDRIAIALVNLQPNYVAKFSYGSRTFIAINDGMAGYQKDYDAIIEITGYKGTIDSNIFA